VLDIDYVLPSREIARVIMELSVTPLNRHSGVPEDVIQEANIAERVLSDIQTTDEIGERSQFTCPDCGGVLWEIKHGNLLRYRCHTGHTFTAKVYLREQTDAIEEVLWVAMRLFGERKMMYKRLIEQQEHSGIGESVSLLEEKLQEVENNIERIRNLLMIAEVKDEDIDPLSEHPIHKAS
jgi:two-component system chemotaxis response regulator CheB